MRARIVLVALLLIVTVALGACGDTGGGAEEVASPGERIFASRCAVCHSTGAEAGIGPGLGGLFAPGGPALPDGVDYGGRLPNCAAITDENVAAWIRAGGQGQIGKMPGMPLSEQEMADLLTYLKTLER
jgi:cytochrome c